MIEFIKISDDSPYKKFKELYEKAIQNNQDAIEAIAISSFNKNVNEVDSRYVNLKYINNDQWIFFTNYNSKKAEDFISHNQISALFFWSTINTQIRMRGTISKCHNDYSDTHFKQRDPKKNALAISSNQSDIIDSYEKIIENYNKILNSSVDLFERPKYWGGYSFTPYYFEFWEGHQSRINKRVVFKKIDTDWKKLIIQP